MVVKNIHNTNQGTDPSFRQRFTILQRGVCKYQIKMVTLNALAERMNRTLKEEFGLVVY